MNKRTFLMVTSLGLGLVACGDKEAAEEPPATPEGPEEPVFENPPPPDMPDGPELPGGEEPDGEGTDGDLPTWDEVKSGHPEGATNPPIPELVVTPDGQCFKNWRGAMIPPQKGEVWGDRVEDCKLDCGTEIQCPDKAKELLEAYNAVEEPPVINKNPPMPMPEPPG